MRSRNHFRNTQKKRYEARRFRNPFFQKKPKRHYKELVISVLLIGVIGAMTWFFLGSRFFAIQNVTVTGTETISSDELVARVWNELNQSRALFFSASNRFLFDLDLLQKALSTSYFFETLTIDQTCGWKGEGCSLVIFAKEKTSQLLWKSDDRIYLVDLQGMVIRELSPQEREVWNAPPPPPPEPLPDGTIPSETPLHPLKKLPVFIDENSANVSVGTAVLSEVEVTNAFQFFERLKSTGITFTSTRVDRLAGKWMSLQTTVGYDILFDASGDVNAQANALMVLLRDTVKDPSGLEYIDLRFGDHVYYK